MAPRAAKRTRWMIDDPSTLAAAALEHHPHPDRILRDEVLALVDAISQEPDPTRHHFGANVDVGGEKVYCSAREIRIVGTTINYSPRMTGLHLHEHIPAEAGIAEKALRMVRQELGRRGYKGPDIKGARDDRDRRYGFASVLFTLERPEGGGMYDEKGSFEHKPDEELVAEARKVAESIEMRWRNRHDIYGRIAGADKWAREAVAKIEGVEYVGIPAPGYIHYGKQGVINTIIVTCTFSVIGHTLSRTTGSVTAHNEDQMRKLINQHRRNARKLEQADGVPRGRTVEPILAAAIRDKMHRFGEGMLREIEAVIEGRHVRPDSPVKRGISLFNMRNGELVGPVRLGKKVRFHKERVNAPDIKSLPDTVMNALPGRAVREVIDHPYLEGLRIRSATINSIGLNIRPEPAPQPLDPLLEELRAAVAAKRRQDQA